MTRDIRWNGQDIVIDETGDIGTVGGTDVLEQSLAILVRDEIRDLVGRTVTPSALAEAEAAINRAIERDNWVSGVRSLALTTVDKQTNTIVVEAQTTANETFQTQVQL